MNQAVNPNLVAKLQKLLALAEKGSGATEAEAEAAMAKVQELMAEHNLTMSEVVARGGQDTEKREKSEVKLKHGNGRGAMYEYQRTLMAAIAEANFCMHLIRTTDRKWTGERWTAGKKMHVLIGRESNVIAATLMFEYLNETMERLVPIEGNASRLSKSSISWKEGCAARLTERLRDRTRELMRQSHAEAEEKRRAAREASAASSHPGAAPASANALVVVELRDVFSTENDLNRDAYYGYEPGTTARQRAERDAQWEADRQEAAKRAREAQPKAETAAERRAREKEEAKAEERSRKYWERAERRERQKWASKDLSAYSAGRKTGEKIGLDTQVGRSDSNKIGG